MNRKRRLTAVVLLGALGALAAVSALAWACTPQAHVYVNPASAPSGSQVTVHGRGFSQGPVRVYWGSTEGTPIAAATGPEFTVSARLPEAAPGVYYIVARGYDGDGAVAGEAPRAFKVTAPTVSQPAPVAKRPARPTPRPAHRGATRGDAPAAESPRAVQPATHAAVRPVAHAGGQPAAKPVSSAARATVPRAHRRPAAARSANAGASPSRQSASGDLWSGFRTGPGPALGLTEAAAAGKEPGWQLAAGIGSLAIGFLGLLAGLAVAGARRRRPVSNVERDTHG